MQLLETPARHSPARPRPLSQTTESAMATARFIRDARHGTRITYSPKVFIPLTMLCRDTCGYCTFAQPPARLSAPFLRPAEVLEIARQGARTGCHEALFTLGEAPEDRYTVAREWLDAHGYDSTVHYLHDMAGRVRAETGLLVHANAGALSADELRLLREVAPSQGMMIETLRRDLPCHRGAPDKTPERRLATLEAAGEAAIAFTTGILVGIGETRDDRIAALEAIVASHGRHGHVQEVIVQNFVPKPGTAMRDAPPCPREEFLWSIATARAILPPEIHLQAPPNLSDDFGELLDAGIDDWGGVSPVTADHVNPERPWPELDRLRATTEARGFALAPRLTIYPEFAAAPERWLHADLRFGVLDRSDAEGLGRDDPGAVWPEKVTAADVVHDGAEVVLVGHRSTAWYAGATNPPPTLIPAHHAGPTSDVAADDVDTRHPAANRHDLRRDAASGLGLAKADTGDAPPVDDLGGALAVGTSAHDTAAVSHDGKRAPRPSLQPRGAIAAVIAKAEAGDPMSADDIVTLFRSRGREVTAVAEYADHLRHLAVGDAITWVHNRNINYTNVCTFKCRFCGFSKGPLSLNLRGTPYLLTLDDIAQRAAEAERLGATEVTLQGGIHPDFDGEYYIDVTHAVRAAAPSIHIHGFTALEVTEGAKRLGEDLVSYLARLKAAGLSSLPGTAAEILDDPVRAILCPDKATTDEWLDCHAAAHEVGLASNITMMFGAVESPASWARHLIRTRELQRTTGGFTEFVGLPFVHMASPIYLQRASRRGPTFRETVLVHAVARIVYHGLIDNIQLSWVKVGEDAGRQLLRAGCNDVGGTLMDENISRAAGANHGQMMTRERFTAMVEPLGRRLEQRTTTYGRVDALPPVATLPSIEGASSPSY